MKKKKSGDLLVASTIIIVGLILFIWGSNTPNQVDSSDNSTNNLRDESIDNTDEESPEANQEVFATNKETVIDHIYIPARHCWYYEINVPFWRVSEITINSDREIQIWTVNSLEEYDDCIYWNNVNGITKKYGTEFSYSNISENEHFILIRTQKNGASTKVEYSIDYERKDSDKFNIWLYQGQKYNWEEEGTNHTIEFIEVDRIDRCLISLDGTEKSIRTDQKELLKGRNIEVKKITDWYSWDADAEYTNCLLEIEAK